jgi:hypothetical protein
MMAQRIDPERTHEERQATALDLLEDENRLVGGLIEGLGATRGSSVEARAEHGDLAKDLIRHAALREAALVDVAQGLEGVAGLARVTDRLRHDMVPRRRAINTLEHMSRGVQPIALNTGQDFEGALSDLSALLRSEIEWQTTEALPAIRRTVRPRDRCRRFHSADRVTKHAPSNLSPRGPRWYERAPVISRILTVYGHLRDFPRAYNSGKR